MRIIFCLILSVFTCSVEAQDPDINPRKNIIKISPLKLIDVSNAAVELTFERATGNRFSTGLTVGWLLPNNPGSGSVVPNPNSRGVSLALEEKYYLRASAPRGSYLAAGLSFLKNRYKAEEDFIDADAAEGLYPEDHSYRDEIIVNKQTLTFFVKWGYQFHINRFSLEVYGGLGIRYKDVYHSERENLTDELLKPRHPNVFHEQNRAGKYLTMSLPLSFRVGYVF